MSMKIFEIYTSYSTTRVWHVAGHTQEEALAHFRHRQGDENLVVEHKSYESNDDSSISIGDDGPWSLTEHIEGTYSKLDEYEFYGDEFEIDDFAELIEKLVKDES